MSKESRRARHRALLRSLKAYATEAERPRWLWGILFRLASFWVGIHYNRYNRRLCINLVPCVTFWVCAPGGRRP